MKWIDIEEWNFEKEFVNNQLNLKNMNKENNPKYIEYWRKVMPSKSDEELTNYMDKWSNENPKYLKFKNL